MRDEKEMINGLQDVDLSEAPKKGKDDGGFQEVDLHKPTKVDDVTSSSPEPRLSGQMSNFRNSLRLDDDEEEDEQPTQKAPGAW